GDGMQVHADHPRRDTFAPALIVTNSVSLLKTRSLYEYLTHSMQLWREARSPTPWAGRHALGRAPGRRPGCTRAAPAQTPTRGACPACHARQASAWSTPSPPAGGPATRRADPLGGGRERPRRHGNRFAQDHPTPITLRHQPLQGGSCARRSGTRPPHDQPPLMPSATPGAADQPPVIREALAAELLGAAACAPGMEP